MILSKEIITKLLSEIGSIFNYEIIITGSCADMFHIGYSDIEDLDFIINQEIYEKCISIDNLFKNKLKLVYTLQHKKDKHLLNTYIYDKYKIDIMIKDKSLIPNDIVNIVYESKSYKVFSAEVRYDQLINNNYKKNFSSNYDLKIAKVSERIKSYQKLLGING